MEFDLIKKDDLNWNEDDQKYVLFSDDELDKIIMAYVTDESGDQRDNIFAGDCEAVVRWAEQARADHLLLQGVLAGRIKIDYNPDEMPSDRVKFYSTGGNNDLTTND